MMIFLSDMKVLDLFSGIGGFSLGLERAGMETIAFCEYDEKCRLVLNKHWPDVPIHEDVRTLDARQYRGTIDLVCGGYPCQPFSTAGRREGEGDDRHLWPEFFRIIRECQPNWIIAENVAGHISMGLDQVLVDLEGEGYTSQPFVIPACAVNAPHRRDRVWIVANNEERSNRPYNAESVKRQEPESREGFGTRDVSNTSGDRGRLQQITGLRGKDTAFSGDDGKTQHVAYANRNGLERLSNPGEDATASSEIYPRGQTPGTTNTERGHWDAEPDVGRVAHGIPGRVDRLRQLGNAVLPQIPEIIGRAILCT